MSDRMPEDMSDRMPEDLPVRKSINVMVGITRSKVIFMIIVLDVAIIMIIIVMSIILIASYCYVATSTIIPLCTNLKNIKIETDMQGYPTILWMVAKSCTTKRMVNPYK